MRSGHSPRSPEHAPLPRASADLLHRHRPTRPARNARPTLPRKRLETQRAADRSPTHSHNAITTNWRDHPPQIRVTTARIGGSRLRRMRRRPARARTQVVARLFLQPPQPLLVLLNPRREIENGTRHTPRRLQEKSGRPGLKPGTSPTRIMGKSGVAERSTCRSHGPLRPTVANHSPPARAA